MRAAAAVPEPEAATDKGTPSNVKTEPETLDAGSASVIVASTAPIALVPISNFPAAPASIASRTACIRVVFNPAA